MKLVDALKRIEELERKVRELEARPVQHNHFYYPPAPHFDLAPPCLPWQPLGPTYQPWIVTCDTITPNAGTIS